MTSTARLPGFPFLLAALVYTALAVWIVSG